MTAQHSGPKIVPQKRDFFLAAGIGILIILLISWLIKDARLQALLFFLALVILVVITGIKRNWSKALVMFLAWGGPFSLAWVLKELLSLEGCINFFVVLGLVLVSMWLADRLDLL